MIYAPIPYSSQNGNVLFLILIAVALFAALSYAVTSSSRSGGSDASKETDQTNIAALIQFPASLRTGITRLMLSRNMALADIDFSLPSDVAGLPQQFKDHNIFNPEISSVVFQDIPAGLKDSAASGSYWIINSNNEVKSIGKTSSPAPNDTPTVEVIAFARGIKQSACQRINQSLNITGIPIVTMLDHTNPQIYGEGLMGAGGGGSLGSEASSSALEAKDQGCFEYSGEYSYYSVLVER